MNQNAMAVGSPFAAIVFVLVWPFALQWRNPGGRSSLWYFELCYAGALLIANAIAIVLLFTKRDRRVWQAGLFLVSSAVAFFGIVKLFAIGPH